jgi:aspartyl/asparaginyl beta-hydroxylase (cupin superfamily)
MKKVWKFFCAVQELLEAAWPLPVRGSMLNISIRDAIYSLLLYLVLLRVHWIFIAAALLVEPALACFPYNVLHSLVVYSPRFWDYRAVDPKLALFLTELPAMRSEALKVADLAVPFSSNKHQMRIAEGQPWNVFSFVSYGTINYANCARCPTIASLVLQIPSVKLAMLSIMEGDTRIKRHCGYFKNVLRCHITLHVDNEEDSLHVRYIDVGGQKYHWKQDDLVVFDDTYPHTVENTVPGRRIVLFLDVERPYTSKASKWLSKAFLTFLQTSKTLAEAAKFQEKNSFKVGARNGIRTHADFSMG